MEIWYDIIDYKDIDNDRYKISDRGIRYLIEVDVLNVAVEQIMCSELIRISVEDIYVYRCIVQHHRKQDTYVYIPL